MEKEIIKKIENLIERANKRFEADGRKNSYALSEMNGRICGMLDVLEMVTGKSYVYDENGVRESKQG